MKPSYAVNDQKRITVKKEPFLKRFGANKFLFFMTLPGIIYFIIFAYIPMFGLIIAFQNFNPIAGFMKSKFVGLKNFEFFFGGPDWLKITANTLYLNALFIITGLVFSIIIAITLSEIGNVIFKKISQSLVILPHFMSWTVVSMFSVALLSGDRGYFNLLLKGFGMATIDFSTNPSVWPALLVILKIWQGAGFGSIVYLAAIAGIDQEIYEACRIDGASRLQSIFYITIPLLKNTAIMLLILAVGKIFYGDFGMIYALVGNNPTLYPTTDVIDTYVYRSLMQLGDMSMASAVGFYQSIVGFILVITSNAIAKKASPESAIF